MTQDKRFKQVVRKRMTKTGESYSAARAAITPRSDTDVMAPEDLIEVTAHGVIQQLDHWAVDLQEVDGERRLQFFVGAAEANAIAMQIGALRDIRPVRPMTHDFLHAT